MIIGFKLSDYPVLLEIMKRKYLKMQKVNNKVRLGVYLDPILAAKFETYRKTLYGIEVSQSSFIKDILEKFFKDIEKR